MLNICLVFWKSEPQYAYKRYAYKKKTCNLEFCQIGRQGQNGRESHIGTEADRFGHSKTV